MTYMIVGAGAMGCLYGAKLHLAGKKVVLIVSRQEAADTINRQGVRVKDGHRETVCFIPACRASEYREQADAILLFTKSVQAEAALDSVKECIGTDTCIVSFQNGIGNEKIMKPYVDADHMIIGTTNFPSDRLGDGVIISEGEGATVLGTVSGNVTKNLDGFCLDLEEAGLHPQIRENIFPAIWEKAAFNAALNSLTAMTLVPQGFMGETEEGRELAHSIVREVCSVALAKNIPVTESRVHETVDLLLDHHYYHCPSMMQDVLQGRITEIETINGAVVHEAEALNLKVPVTKVLYQLVSILQQTYEHRLIRKKM